MEKIKVITDSTVDIPKHILEEKNIEVLPLLINFGEESYLDGIDIDTKKMFQKIEALDMLPTTAQVTPNRFYECFKKNLEEGYKLIVLTLSSEMSGTYQSACIAKGMLETENIIVIDSKNVTSGLGVLALKTVSLINSGISFEKIEAEILKIIPRVKSSLGFESLDYLIKGGRLSRAAGMIGSVLGIRLILEVKDGKMSVKEKVRGNKKAVKKIIQDFEEFGLGSKEPVILLHIENEDIYNPLKAYLEENHVKYIDSEVGCTVGVHSGPKACGLFFIENN